MDSTVTGTSLVFMHPEITNLDPDLADITCQLLDGIGEVQALSDSITKMQALGQNPYWLDPLTDADGNPVILTNTAEGTEGYGEPMLEDGKPAVAKAFTVNPNLGAFTDALSAGVAAVKDEQRLADSTYFVTPSDAPPPPMDAAALAAPAATSSRSSSAARASTGARRSPPATSIRPRVRSRSRSTTTGSGCCRCTCSTTPTPTTRSTSTTTTRIPTRPSRRRAARRTRST